MLGAPESIRIFGKWTPPTYRVTIPLLCCVSSPTENTYSGPVLGLSSCSTLLLSLPSPSNHPAGLLFHYSVVSHLLQKTHTPHQCWVFHPALHFCSHCHHHLTILQGYYSTTLSCLISYRKHILRTSAGSFILLYTFALIAITI